MLDIDMRGKKQTELLAESYSYFIIRKLKKTKLQLFITDTYQERQLQK